jgi:hypothetical protein
LWAAIRGGKMRIMMDWKSEAAYKFLQAGAIMDTFDIYFDGDLNMWIISDPYKEGCDISPNGVEY